MDPKRRYVPLKDGDGIYKELGSEFIARLYRVDNVEECKQKEESFRKENPKADHYPYALFIADYSKSSDDGEPGGTAGKAIASLLSGKGIDHVFLIVARYFGGTKLGVPGLRRAFLSAAEKAIADAKFGEETIVLDYPISVSYSEYELLASLARRGEFEMLDIDFSINVNLTLRSSGTIDGIFEKKGIRIELPTPKRNIIYKEVNNL